MNFENMNPEAFDKAMQDAATDVKPTDTPVIENPVVETPVVVETPATVVETPVATETITPVAVVETPATEAPKTVEVIKEVEKIVEKFPEFKTDKAKQLFEQLTNAEDPKVAEKTVLDYLREKNRDYTVMSDMDVVKAALRKENPTWTKDDVDLKIRRTYGKSLTPIDLNTIDKDLDPDKYEKAEAHNEDVANNLADLRLDALQKRPALIQSQQELELPTIKQTQDPAPSGPTPEQIQAANDAWKQGVESVVPSLSEIKQTIDDKEVVYALNDDDRKALKDNLQAFNLLDYSKKRGWQNEDGTPNIAKLAQDVFWLENKEKISKSYATQIKTDTTKDVLRSIKNVEDTKRPPQELVAGSFEEAYFATLK